MTWGVVVRDGLAYVNDINSGLCGSSAIDAARRARRCRGHRDAR